MVTIPKTSRAGAPTDAKFANTRSSLLHTKAMTTINGAKQHQELGAKFWF